MPHNYIVPFSGARIEATVTNNGNEIDEWVREVRSTYSGQQNIIVGLDCEWRPNTSFGDDNKTATLQLCVDTKCLIVQLFYIDYIPQSLKNFVSDPNMVFVGVEVGDDVSKLRREHGLVCATSRDIQATAMVRWPIEFYRKPGLKMLANKVAGLMMQKPIHVCRSNWEARVLSLQQIEYGCIDAYASCKIGQRMYQ